MQVQKRPYFRKSRVGLVLLCEHSAGKSLGTLERGGSAECNRAVANAAGAARDGGEDGTMLRFGASRLVRRRWRWSRWLLRRKRRLEPRGVRLSRC